MKGGLFIVAIMITTFMVIVGLSVLLSKVISGSLLYILCAIIGIFLGSLSSYVISLISS